MASILPKGKTQFTTLLGRPLAGGKVYFYAPGTETKKDTWQDEALTIPNTNPVILDARGEAVIWGDGSYRQVVKEVIGLLEITIWDQTTSSSVSDVALAGPGGSGLVGTPDGQTIAYQFLSRLNRVVDSIAELRAIDSKQYTRAFATGFYAASDGGGGPYQLDPDDLSSTDNGCTIIVAADGGVWKLQYHGALAVEQGGAKGDGTTDDTESIQSLLNVVNALGGGIVTAHKSYYIGSALTVPANVTLAGPLTNPGEQRYESWNYDSVAGTLILASDVTITLADSAMVQGFQILTKALSTALPFASAAAAASAVGGFAGIAITGGGADVCVRGCLILGFNQAFYSTGYERGLLENVRFDCTNGLDIENCPDIAHMVRCQGWPYLTVHQSWTTDALLVRSGYAYQYANTADWCKATECFSYGYQHGFIFNNVHNVTAMGCGTDYAPSQTSTNIGYYIVGTSLEIVLLGCQGAAQNMGVYTDIVEPAGTQGQNVKIIACSLWGCKTYGVRSEGGRILMNGGTIRGMTTGYGVSLNANAIVAGPSSIAHVDFDAVTTPFDIDAGSIDRHNIRDCNYVNSSDASVGERRIFNNTVSQRFHYKYSTDTGAVVDRYRKARGSSAAPTIVVSGDALAMLQADSYDGSAFGTSAQFRATSAGTPAAGNVPGRWIFSTNPGTGVVDRLLVDENGVFRPVTDNTNSLGTAAARFSTVFAATGTINTSDEDTKTDISDSVLGLDFINSLRPVSYKFKVGGVEIIKQVYRNAAGDECASTDEGAVPAEIITQERAGIRLHFGLLAGEVKTAIDAAGTDFGGYTRADPNDPNSLRGLRYDQFIAPLIKAVQQQTQVIAALTARVQKLEGDEGFAQPA